MGMHANEAIKQSVQAGMGLSITSLHGIELKPENNRPVIQDVVNFPIMRHWHIVYRANKRLSTAGRVFKQFLFCISGFKIGKPKHAPHTTICHRPVYLLQKTQKSAGYLNTQAN